MKSLLRPDKYYKDIFSINYDSLLQMGVKCLLFDLDNTIARTKQKESNESIDKLFDKLKKDFKVIILSNAFKGRIERFSSLCNDYYYLSFKPSSYNYKKVLNKYGFKVNEIVAIGDQIFTDVKGAKRLGITSILVDPIGGNEFIITKFNRHKENKIFKRGEYYE